MSEPERADRILARYLEALVQSWDAPQDQGTQHQLRAQREARLGFGVDPVTGCELDEVDRADG